ncbi:MAG: RebB family R body protein [Acidobacteriota bacterium]
MPQDPPQKVNPQIVDAVETTNAIVLSKAATMGMGAVSQQIAQAVGLAVQDSVDHLQNALTLDSAVSGQALAIILADPEKIPQAELALQKANQVVQDSIQDVEEIGKAVASVLSDLSSAVSSP